jgi:hypothetical protein
VWFHFVPSNQWLVEVIVRGEGGILYREREYPAELPDMDVLVTEAREHGFPSTRPFRLGAMVDPSLYYCVLALFLAFCEQHALDAVALERQACSHVPDRREIDFELIREQSQWEGVQIPSAWSPLLFSDLLDALSEIGCDSLADVLETKVGLFS